MNSHSSLSLSLSHTSSGAVFRRLFQSATLVDSLPWVISLRPSYLPWAVHHAELCGNRPRIQGRRAS